MAPGDSVGAPGCTLRCVLDVVNNPLILVLMETPVKAGGMPVIGEFTMLPSG